MSTSQSEASRAAKHSKAREAMMADFEKQKQSLMKESERGGKSAGERFVGKIDSIDEALKKSTVGLVKLEDFQRTRLELEEKKRLESGKEKQGKDKDEKKKKNKDGKGKKDKTAEKGKKKLTNLSFQLDEEEQEGAQDDSFKSNKKRKLDDNDSPKDKDKDKEDGFKLSSLKNPSVDTSFLPDKSREEKERLDRENLRKEWLEKQEQMKNEEIQITYSWWDGSGHRKVVKCKKGDSIATFLEKCRLQFPDLRGISVDNMMYIKEDLIIPHHYTFYDFIVNKARGKSGPLFNFDVHDDIRLLADARIEKDESHAGKVVERGWYNRNKHIFPASRWEVYDPKKDYGTYTIG